jgi:cell volume regulation protein A
VLGAALAVLIRPVLVGLCLLPARLRARERAFVLFAGLKGAVPLLLGSLLLSAHIPDAQRLYSIVVVVVVFSVVLQGGLVPTVAHALHLPMRTVEPQPFSLGVRLTDEPEEVLRLHVTAGSRADGRTVDDIAGLDGEVWVNLLVRQSKLLAVRGDTRLHPGDEVLITADAALHRQLEEMFVRPALGTEG